MSSCPRTASRPAAVIYCSVRRRVGCIGCRGGSTFSSPSHARVAASRTSRYLTLRHVLVQMLIFLLFLIFRTSSTLPVRCCTSARRWATGLHAEACYSARGAKPRSSTPFLAGSPQARRTDWWSSRWQSTEHGCCALVRLVHCCAASTHPHCDSPSIAVWWRRQRARRYN